MCLVDMNEGDESKSVTRILLDTIIKEITEAYQEPMPEYIQLELDFLDEMFEKRIEDPRS